MPTPPTSRRGLPPTALAATALVLLSLAGGWWLGRRQSAAPDPDPKRAVLLKEVTRLSSRLERDEAGEGDRQRLLELLIGLDRSEEAIALLEPMADREPDRWSLRLMLAELRRERNDRSGAERELRQILSRHPTQVETLQLFTLLKLEQGRGGEAEARVRKAYEAATRPQPKPEALGLGLLLAELQQRRGQAAQAEATYQQLVSAFPQDQRPLLALALIRHDRGNLRGAQEALNQARLRSPDPGKPDPRLDELAASWGLAPLRAPAGSSPDPKKEETPEPSAPRTP
ncbi:MAG: tetratricopeptide repeat protein [Synechococcaceae cyanobacterium]|nr:tetratricopeptide repeat protein [Synechococcaceae cyanobacterium]